jgi:hypothetical protein
MAFFNLNLRIEVDERNEDVQKAIRTWARVVRESGHAAYAERREWLDHHDAMLAVVATLLRNRIDVRIGETGVSGSAYGGTLFNDEGERVAAMGVDEFIPEGDELDVVGAAVAGMEGYDDDYWKSL